MATLVASGTDSYARYGYESTFNTAPADSVLVNYFGHNVKYTATAKNNIERIPNLNARNYSKYAAKKFEGTFTVDFQVSNAYWLKGIVGTPTTTGAGPYTHTYAETLLPTSATIQSSENMDTDSERTFTGCLFDKLTLTCNVGDVVTGRIDGMYAKEIKDATLNANGNSADSEEPFTFSQATLEIPNATEKFEVQSLELSILNNTEMLWGLGSRFGTKRTAKTRVYELKMTRIRELDADVLDSFYGSTTTLSDPGTPANVASLDLVLSNDDTSPSTDERTVHFTLANLQYDDYSAPLNPNEVTKETVTMYALSASSITYLNNTSSHP